MSNPLGPVVITAREIYDVLLELRGSVSVLVAQHNSAVKDQQEHEQHADDRHNDHEARLRAVERRLWPLPTLGVLLAMASMVLGAFALNKP